MPVRNKAVVLVVEDEVLVRMMLADVLDEAGFRVIEAAHADEALSVLTALPEVQAVVTDVEMPGGSMNGFALAREVRTQRPDIGVLIASGRAAPNLGDLPELCYFLAKPVHPATLVHMIRSLLALSDASRRGPAED
jgi:CheY-like chemotaxis protein